MDKMVTETFYISPELKEKLKEFYNTDERRFERVYLKELLLRSGIEAQKKERSKKK